MLCGLQTPEETLEQLENGKNIILGEGCWVGLKEDKEAEKYNFRSNYNIFLSGIVAIQKKWIMWRVKIWPITFHFIILSTNQNAQNRLFGVVSQRNSDYIVIKRHNMPVPARILALPASLRISLERLNSSIIFLRAMQNISMKINWKLDRFSENDLLFLIFLSREQ